MYGHDIYKNTFSIIVQKNLVKYRSRTQICSHSNTKHITLTLGQVSISVYIRLYKRHSIQCERYVFIIFDQYPQYNLKYHIYGHENELPESNISLIRVSIGVLPTNLTKNSCSITAELTVRKLGNRSRSLPNLVGWLGYCVLQYSSRAH